METPLQNGKIEQDASQTVGEAERSISPNDRFILLKVFIVFAFLAGCLFVGFQREANHPRKPPIAYPTLYYGDSAPPFQLPNTSGGTTSLSDLRGKWSLLVFGIRGCEACDKELSGLAAIYPHLRDKVNIVAVMAEQSLFPFAQKIVGQYAQRLRIKYPMLIDEGFRVHYKYCDGPILRLPFSVLLDPEGKVRFVQDGYEIQGDRRSVVAAMVSNLAQGKPLLPSLKERSSSSASLPDGEVILSDGKRERLSRLWRGRTLVLFFCDENVPVRCQEQRVVFSRFQRANGAVKVLFLYRTRLPARESHSTSLFLTGFDAKRILFTRYGAESNLTLVIHDGRILMAEGSRTCCANLLLPTVGQSVLEDYLRSTLSSRKEVRGNERQVPVVLGVGGLSNPGIHLDLCGRTA